MAEGVYLESVFRVHGGDESYVEISDSGSESESIEVIYNGGPRFPVEGNARIIMSVEEAELVCEALGKMIAIMKEKK